MTIEIFYLVGLTDWHTWSNVEIKRKSFLPVWRVKKRQKFHPSVQRRVRLEIQAISLHPRQADRFLLSRNASSNALHFSCIHNWFTHMNDVNHKAFRLLIYEQHCNSIPFGTFFSLTFIFCVTFNQFWCGRDCHPAGSSCLYFVIP